MQCLLRQNTAYLEVRINVDSLAKIGVGQLPYIIRNQIIIMSKSDMGVEGFQRAKCMVQDYYDVKEQISVISVIAHGISLVYSFHSLR